MTTKPSKKAKPQVQRPSYLDVVAAREFAEKIARENKEWLKEMASR